MKKIISASLVCLLLVGMVLVLASCGNKLSGTYEGPISTYEFKRNGDFVRKSGAVSVSGTYEIEENDDGDLTITFFYGEDEDDDKDGIPQSFEKGDDFIRISGVKYEKK